MVSPALRVAVCIYLGLVLGGVLGVLFVPDPTSPVAAVLALAVAATVSAVLYRSDWLRAGAGAG